MEKMRDIHVLIPTFKRLKALAVTLTGLCFQSEKSFEVTISDQALDDSIRKDKTIQTVINLLKLHDHPVTILKNYPQKGMAQQRQFLLDHSNSPYSLFLDDDVILEPYVLQNMKLILQKYKCGFVGSALTGLSYRNDHRPHQQHIEFWEDEIYPETIVPEDDLWQRYKLHNAANILHVQEKYSCTPDNPKPYKVAWVGGCVMYDTQKLSACGGFEFWKDLPEQHCGEDVLAQLRVMKKFGGCGILPSGAYHQEVETSINDRKINAPEFLKV
ncbi:MAG TPA: glycosyltransferase family A protein [Hanamia sp.]|jgi:glycosyltransferase involved in cell wall biosynthesis|nr:glycosyltransferase family A protein [Hanamia sp.]